MRRGVFLRESKRVPLPREAAGTKEGIYEWEESHPAPPPRLGGSEAAFDLPPPTRGSLPLPLFLLPPFQTRDLEETFILNQVDFQFFLQSTFSAWRHVQLTCFLCWICLHPKSQAVRRFGSKGRSRSRPLGSHRSKMGERELAGSLARQDPCVTQTRSSGGFWERTAQEIPGEEVVLSSDAQRQRFRHSRYQEAEGPREVLQPTPPPLPSVAEAQRDTPRLRSWI
uniref:uncharacterized protein LOC114591077 n=1 Tax=Podarcis muralis TaxID=64176 RepID=UPI00109FCC7C|nr:uncharacterized protein LOC114591077 [Podarcis muralis]